MSARALIPLARSLRVDARSAGTYLLRGGLLLAVFLGLILGRESVGRLGAPGRWFFSATAYITFFFITAMALSYFAAVIAEEKDQRTLSLLLLTGMSPVSILLGKSTSRLLAVLFLLALQIPFAILAIPLGGISLNQILATYCTLPAHFFFLTSVALCCSVVASTTRVATTLTGVLLLLFFLGPILGQALAAGLVSDGVLPRGHFVVTTLRDVCELWRRASAFNRLREILSVGFTGSLAGLQVISNAAGGVTLFGLAWACFGPFNREEKNPAPAGPTLSGKTARRHKPSAVWPSPLIWKDFQFLVGGPRMWVVQSFLIVFAVGLTTWMMDELGRGRFEPFQWAGGFLLASAVPLLILELAFIAGRVFGEEIRWRTLPGLAMLPLSIPQIAYRKVAGSLPGALPPVVWFSVGAFLAPDAFAEILDDVFGSEGEVLAIFAYAVAGVLLAIHLSAFLSLWMRHGALLVSLAGVFVGQYMVAGVMVMMLVSGPSRSGETIIGFAFLTGCVLVLSSFLHLLIGPRLRALAAE